MEDAPKTDASACAVTRLRLHDFRNYADLSLDLSAQVVVLNGANGAGKTNLMEAISFLAPGRGLRRSRLRDMQRQGAPVAADGSGWAVAATVVSANGPVRLGSSLAKTDRGGDRRLARQDGQTMAPANLSQVIGVQWLTPQMDRLFLEGPSSRRRFLDRLVLGLDPDHGRRVGAYERSMRERAKLLRDGAGDAAWLSALETRMAADGVAVAAARREALARLQRFLGHTPGPFPTAELSIDGRLENWLQTDPAVEVESRFAGLLLESRNRDAATGHTAEGPHRTDLLVRHVEKDQAAEICSTGEQKALLLAVMLANARAEAERRGAAPILLLDEVAAHLDRERRSALFGEILALGGQAWLSGTDRELFESLVGQAQFVTVAQGQASLDDVA